jgi:hypothetical protein
MAASPELIAQTDARLRDWRQGDVVIDKSLPMLHLAIAGSPLTPEAELAANEDPDGKPEDAIIVTGEAPGFVVLSQTCDLVRSCSTRPYVELAALIEVNADHLREVQKRRRPTFAYIPALANQRLVADLDRTMTVEKTVLASLNRQPGLGTTQETVDFQAALARNKARFAFPDDFVVAVSGLQDRLKQRARRDSSEGRHVDALAEIRFSAAPSWEAEKIELTLWLIKESDPQPSEWPAMVATWTNLIDQSGRYSIVSESVPLRPEDMRVSDYLTSHQLDLDYLS